MYYQSYPQKHQVPRYNVPPYTQVLPNVFIGSYQSVEMFGNRSPGVSLVVNCTPDVPPPQWCGEFVRIPVWDNLNPYECKKMQYYLQEYQVLERIHSRVIRGESVLIHCVAGMQRSCAVLACYLCKYYGMHMYEAVNFIRSYRPIAFNGGVNFADTVVQYNPIQNIPFQTNLPVANPV